MKQPDKLFQEKLRGYERPVPTASWDRIAANLHKKKSDKIWLKLAASLLLVALCGIALWNLLDDPSAKNLSRRSEKPVPEQSAKANDALSAETIPPTSEKIETPGQEKFRPPVNVITTPKKKEDSNNTEKNDLLPSTSPVVTDHTPVPENSVAKTESAIAALRVNDQRSVTLIFNAEQVNEKFLNKNSIVEATPEEKKPSTLRKLLDKAYDLKHNQDPLGDLRQKKNEIFALNFKNDKQRSENQ